MNNRPQYKIYTADLKPNQGIGVALPFNQHNIFTINYTTKDQTKSNLLNFMLTNRGERPFNPEFGANLRNLLFEPNTDLPSIQNSLLIKIQAYFPDITVNQLVFTPSEDYNSVNIALNYSLNHQNDSLSIQIG